MKDKKIKAIVLRSPSPEALIAQAIQKGTPVETIERIMAMAKEIRTENAKHQYDRAMAEFQAECPIIKKDKLVKNKDGTVRYRYATLDSIIRQAKPLLKKHGFSYKIETLTEEKWMTAICKATHELGHSESSNFKIPTDSDAYMSAPQKFASALTFAKRYAFCDVFGIMTVDEDDDANSTTGENGKEYMALLNLIKKMKIKDLESCLARLDDPKAKKYTPDQKKSLAGIISERIFELESIDKK